MDQKLIGKFIAALRKEQQMTQEQLAEKLGVNYRSVSRWENGHCMPDISLLQPLAEELGISVSELLSGKHTDEEQELKNAISTLIELSDREKHSKTKKLTTYFFTALICFTLSYFFRSYPAIKWLLLGSAVLSELLGFHYNVMGKSLIEIQPEFFLKRKEGRTMRTAKEMLQFAAEYQEIKLKQYELAFQTIEKALMSDETVRYAAVAEDFRINSLNRMMHAALVVTQKRLLIGGEGNTKRGFFTVHETIEEIALNDIVSAERIGSVLRLKTETREMEFRFSNSEVIDNLIKNLTP